MKHTHTHKKQKEREERRERFKLTENKRTEKRKKILRQISHFALLSHKKNLKNIF